MHPHHYDIPFSKGSELIFSSGHVMEAVPGSKESTQKAKNPSSLMTTTIAGGTSFTRGPAIIISSKWRLCKKIALQFLREWLLYAIATSESCCGAESVHSLSYPLV